MQVPAGSKEAVLTDLSRSGAQLQLEDAPALGSPVLMRWNETEALGQVVWTGHNGCSIRFDRMLAEVLVEQTADYRTRRIGPPASQHRIRFGKRRSAFI